LYRLPLLRGLPPGLCPSVLAVEADELDESWDRVMRKKTTRMKMAAAMARREFSIVRICLCVSVGERESRVVVGWS
jgi:hypothetical protein